LSISVSAVGGAGVRVVSVPVEPLSCGMAWVWTVAKSKPMLKARNEFLCRQFMDRC
jgi:hypothetical protein